MQPLLYLETYICAWLSRDPPSTTTKDRTSLTLPLHFPHRPPKRNNIATISTDVADDNLSVRRSSVGWVLYLPVVLHGCGGLGTWNVLH